MEKSSTFKFVEADRKKTPVVTFWISKPSFDYLEGIFEYSVFFLHSRAILFIKPYCFLMVDGMETKRPYLLKELFHVQPAVDVLEQGDLDLELSVGDSLKCLIMCLSHPPDKEARTIKGQKSPEYQGWYSKGFGEFIEALVVEYSFSASKGQYYLVHLILPIGKDNTSDYKLVGLEPDNWHPYANEPLRFAIEEPGFSTTISYFPLALFFNFKVNDLRSEPRIEVQRRKR